VATPTAAGAARANAAAASDEMNQRTRSSYRVATLRTRRAGVT
jgi:hypothetical protein